MQKLNVQHSMKWKTLRTEQINEYNFDKNGSADVVMLKRDKSCLLLRQSQRQRGGVGEPHGR